MSRVRVARPSPSMVVALLALFVALGGTSIAAVQLARDSVGTEQVKNESVTGGDIRTGAVGSVDIRNGTIVHDDVKRDTLTGDRFEPNTLGSRQLGDNSVGADDLGSGVVGRANLAANAVTGGSVADGSIGAADLTSDLARVASGPGGPSGPAGGVLDGTYPNPALAIGGIDSPGVFAASLKDGAAGTPTLRSLGTGPGEAAGGDDPRLSDARTPTGAAGGDLSGTYPNASLAAGSVSGGTGGEIVDDSVTGVDVDELALDNSVVQRRIGGSCGGTLGLQSVANNGNAGCAAFVPEARLLRTGFVTLGPGNSATLFSISSARVLARCDAGPTAVVTIESLGAGQFLNYQTRANSGVVGASTSTGAPADVVSTASNDLLGFGILTNSFQQLDGQVALSAGGGTCSFSGTGRSN